MYAVTQISITADNNKEAEVKRPTMFLTGTEAFITLRFLFKASLRRREAVDELINDKIG